jgi:hypothetical protein
MEIISATEGNLVPSRSKLVYGRYTKKGLEKGGLVRERGSICVWASH